MHRTAIVLLLLAGPALAQHAVWVVAPQPGPGVDFTYLDGAVTAAASGDTILLKAGYYKNFGGVPDSFAAPNKTLSIAADAGALVEFDACEVANLKAGYLVTLSHIVFSSSVDDAPALDVHDNAGAVWLDHCKLTGGGSAAFAINATSAMRIVNCDSVVLTHSDLVGGHAVSGAPGLVATDSNVYVFRSTVTGGTASCLQNLVPPCGNAGPGIAVTGGQLALQSSQIYGGTPNQATPCFPLGFCTCSSTGGSALHLEDGAQIDAYDVQLSAGAAVPPCGFANPVTTDIVSGQLDSTAGPGFEIKGSSPLRVGQTGSFDVSGQPGDGAFAVLAIPPAAIWVPKFHGPWLTGGDYQFLFIGTVPATGGISFSFTVPSLPPGFESVEFIAQGVRVAPGTGILLANPYRGILLDH